MEKFVIEGGTPLSGTVHPAGNKNAALPIIAAALLTEDEVILRNVPRIRDVEAMLDILNNSAAKSGLISYKAPFVFKRDFTTNFSTKWMHKDITLAVESGRSEDVPMPLTAITQQMLQAAISRGYGDQDFCSLIRIEEEWAGVNVKDC